MTLSSDWQIGKCLEWYTELPFFDRPRESPVFLIENIECYFHFCKQSSNYPDYSSYYLYLKPKMTCIELKSFPIVIYSDHNGTSEGVFSRFCGNFDDSNKYILYFGELYFKNRGQKLNTGHFIRFFFIFQSENGLSISLGKKNGKLLFCVKYFFRT